MSGEIAIIRPESRNVKLRIGWQVKRVFSDGPVR